MAQYSPELLAAMRHDYEDGNRPMRLVAKDHGIGITTLQSLVEKHGWEKRSQRMRGLPPEQRLLEEARKLEAGMRESQMAATPSPDPCPTLPLAGGGSSETATEESRASPQIAGSNAAPATPLPSSVDLLEAKVRAAIQNVEAAQKNGQPPGPENLARALSIHTETIQAIQRMRAGQFSNEAYRHDDYDMPADIDAFRLALARRIEALAESGPDEVDDDHPGDVAGAV